jgi:N-acetylglucosamine-6-phosphate deacetylase
MTDIRIILAGQVWTPTRHLTNHMITIADGKIAGLVEAQHEVIPVGEDMLDASDSTVIPGLIDLQVNGALGWSFQASDRDHFSEIVAFHLVAGTTTFLPTLVTADETTLLHSLDILADFLDESTLAMLPGIHLEGPFLSPRRHGAHDELALHRPDVTLAKRFIQAAHGRIQMVTLAPELPGAIPLIEYLAQRGLIVSAGHTAATYAEMRRAIAAGLSFVTHSGNASNWPHRAPGEFGFMASEPGVVGTLLAEPGLGGSVILDGYHFHPALLPPLLRLKGSDQLLLVSDASIVAGCPPGDYDGGGLRVTVDPRGFATSGRGGGWLAGSTITLLQAVQRAVSLAGISFQEAVAMASLGPARLLGLEGQKGELVVGKDADLLILNDDLSLRHVIAGGHLVPGYPPDI